MKKSSLITLFAFASLTISCAHKAPHSEDASADTKKAEIKVVEKTKKKDKQAKKDQLAYTCMVGKDKRTVIIDEKDKRCEVHYTKFGDEQQVAWAESTPSICHDAFSKIRTNIEGSGYQCLDGLNAQFEQKKEKDKEKEEKKAEEVTKTVETAAVDARK
jgi:hypothetical protein